MGKLKQYWFTGFTVFAHDLLRLAIENRPKSSDDSEDDEINSESANDPEPSTKPVERNSLGTYNVVPKLINIFTIGRPTKSSSTNLAMSSDNSIKPKDPEIFRGDRTKFRTFRLQCQARLKYATEARSKQVLWIGSFLRDGPAAWLEPHQEDFLFKPVEEQKEMTKLLFANPIKVFEELEKLYGGSGQVKEAERQMHALKQQTFVAAYTTDFRQISARLD